MLTLCFAAPHPTPRRNLLHKLVFEWSFFLAAVKDSFLSISFLFVGTFCDVRILLEHLFYQCRCR